MWDRQSLWPLEDSVLVLLRTNLVILLTMGTCRKRRGEDLKTESREEAEGWEDAEEGRGSGRKGGRGWRVGPSGVAFEEEETWEVTAGFDSEEAVHAHL